jgi:type IV pilus assembly protein PilM
MREEELEGAVRFEAEKLIPFNINKCVLDHQILRRNDKEGKIDLMLVAAKKEYIESRVSAVEDAGLLVSLIDVDACAIANSFMRNFQSPDKEKTFALLNIGAAHTNLNIIKDGVTHFVRDIGVGGADFTAAISQALAVDIDDAEMMKTSAGEKTAPAGEQLKNVFNNLIEEVRLSFGYYENQYGKAIDTVYISGGSIVMPGMEDVFQEAFGSKPLTWDPLSFLEVSGFKGRDLQGLTRHFGVASGLVLR